jgi:hypothetical protein
MNFLTEFRLPLYVRLAGVMYLAIIGVGLFGEFWGRGTVVVPSDISRTAEHIISSTSLWCLSTRTDLSIQLLYSPFIVVFFCLIQRVHAGFNLAATFLI